MCKLVSLRYKTHIIFDIHENIAESIEEKSHIPYVLRRVVRKHISLLKKNL